MKKEDGKRTDSRKHETQGRRQMKVHEAPGQPKAKSVVCPRIKYDAEYISYLENGESVAVLIARDMARNVPTAGRWVDVTETKGWKRDDGRWNFSQIVVELFPRRLHPDYPEGISDGNKKYITWKTAHEDIEQQRRSGVRGEKYRIHIKLVNVNRGKTRTEKALWDKRFGTWTTRFFLKASYNEWRDRKVPVEPKWEYVVEAVTKL
jgi:hypothetical protein